VCYFEQRALPDADWRRSVDALEKLTIEPIMKDDILVIGGDFNCNLGRHQDGVTRRWCVHKQPCLHKRAPYMLDMLRRRGLYAVSTGCQARPTTEGGSATYILSYINYDATKR
jgi:hypothetical protein